MNTILKLIAICIFLSSCGSSRNSYQTTEDKALLQAVKKYHKNPEKTELKAALVQLYDAASKLHLDKIEVYKSLTEADRWDKIIGEYEALQQLHNVVFESEIARQAVSSKNYSAEILAARQSGADAWYQEGLQQLDRQDRQSARNAYNSFKRANKLVPNFKDATRKMDEAFESSVVNVVINPVRETSLGYYGYDDRYSNRYSSGLQYIQDNFQRNLVSDLGSDNFNNRNVPARFYTDYDARRQNINPDWEVDLEWVNLDMPRPRTQQYTRNVSKQIESGRDTSGHPTYRTITATLIITKADYRARGDFELKIREIGTNRSLAYNRYSEGYDWQEEYATYRGNSQALSASDWEIINRSDRNMEPRRDEVMAELYRRVYSQVKNRIYDVVKW